MEWISVKDRLPEFKSNKLSDSVKCLVVANSEKPYTTIMDYRRIEGLGTYWADGDFLMPLSWEITHWMPLPEPPKE